MNYFKNISFIVITQIHYDFKLKPNDFIYKILLRKYCFNNSNHQKLKKKNQENVASVRHTSTATHASLCQKRNPRSPRNHETHRTRSLAHPKPSILSPRRFSGKDSRTLRPPTMLIYAQASLQNPRRSSAIVATLSRF